MDAIRARLRTLPRLVLVGVALAIAASWGLALLVLDGGDGRGGERGADEPEAAAGPDEEPVDDTACALLTPAEVTSVLGTGAETLDGASATACNLQTAGGLGLSLVLNSTPDAAAFRALVTDPGATPLAIGDEAHWWETGSPVGGVLVGRSGGSAVTVTFVGDPLAPLALPPVETTAPLDPATTDTRPPPPTDDQRTDAIEARLTRVGTLVLERVERTEFTGVTGVDVASDTCARIDLTALVAAVGLTDQHVPSLAPLGTSGCTFATATGVNLGIEVLPGPSDAAQLDGLGREAVVDGETRTASPEVEAGLADHAVWLADPVAEGAGELYALYGEVAVRITSNGGREVGDARRRAVAAMELVGPVLTA